MGIRGQGWSLMGIRGQDWSVGRLNYASAQPYISTCTLHQHLNPVS